MHYKNTRFHPNISLNGDKAPIQFTRKGGIRPSFNGGTHSRSNGERFPSLSLSLGGRIPFGGYKPENILLFFAAVVIRAGVHDLAPIQVTAIQGHNQHLGGGDIGGYGDVIQVAHTE